MGDLLIKNAYIITMDKNRRSIPKGAVAIRDNKIIDVGKSYGLAKKYPKADLIIDAKRKVLLPGFINTHSHLFQTNMRSLGDDMVILDWWPHTIVPMAIVMKPEDVYYANLVGCAESIKSGVTTILDNHYIKRTWDLTDQTFEAWRKIGVRGIQASHSLNYDPWNLVKIPGWLKDPDEEIKDLRRLHKKYHGKNNGMFSVWSGTGGPMASSDEYLKECADVTEELGVGMVGHFHESVGEIRQFKQDHNGLTPIQYYHKKKTGLWCNRMVCIHAVVLDEEDRQIFAKTDTRISHNVPSNMYLSSGVAPIPDMLKRGVTVGLGLDGPASNNGQDMMFCLKATVLLHKVHSGDPTIMTAEKVLEMATIDGARAIGMEDKLGSIEKGKIADIIMLNPWMSNMMPIHRLESQIVYCGKAENIDTVIINGKVVLQNRKFTTIDETKVLTKAQELVEKQVERAGEIPQEERKRKWQSIATDRTRKW